MNFIAEAFGCCVFKLLGVTFLYVLGRVCKFISPSIITYDYKEIWNMTYDKHANERSREDAGQIIIGIAVFVLLIFAVRYGIRIIS